MSWTLPARLVLSLSDLASPSGPASIVDGEHAQACSWPSAVALSDGWDVRCTGSLVHPRVVLTAAHCVESSVFTHIAFGEDFETSPRRASISRCRAYPDFDNDWNTNDLALCVLDQPVEDVPIVPLLSGCEAEAIVPGAEVVIAGFGATATYYDEEGEVSSEGAGFKRLARQRVSHISLVDNKVFLLPIQPNQSACHGDSGGPSFIRLSDGTWRVFGAASHLYNPEDPEYMEGPLPGENACGPGVAYAYASPLIDWLEEESGYDLTPCWNGDTWESGPGCDACPLHPDASVGSWATACGDGAVGGGVPMCGVVDEDTDVSSSGSTGDGSGTSSSGGELSTTGTTSAGGSSTSSSSTGDGAASETGAGSSSGSDAGTDEPSTDSCSGCAAASQGAGGWRLTLLGLVLLGLRRRSRR